MIYNLIRKGGIRIVNPTYSQNKERPEKMHYFEYRENLIKESNEREKKLNEKKALDEEFKLLNTIGITKKADMTNFTLLNNYSNKNNNLRYSSDVNGSKMDNYWLKKETQIGLRKEIENSLKDSDYVKHLENWDKKNLSKINTRSSI